MRSRVTSGGARSARSERPPARLRDRSSVSASFKQRSFLVAKHPICRHLIELRTGRRHDDKPILCGDLLSILSLSRIGSKSTSRFHQHGLPKLSGLSPPYQLGYFSGHSLLYRHDFYFVVVYSRG